MNGYVFQCYGETSNKNQFNRTVEELDGYIGINLKHSKDVKKMIKKMKDTVIAMPVDPKDDASKTELKIWEKMIAAAAAAATAGTGAGAGRRKY